MIIKSKLLPSLFGVHAITIAPFIFVRPDKAEDKALLEHEKVHLREQYQYLILPWWILYLLSPSFRLKKEAHAYKVQIAHGGCTVQQAAHWLSTKYMLKISQQQAEELLRK